jgi:hypothetical protein
MELIYGNHLTHAYQKMQQDAAMLAWRGEFRAAVIAMVGSYYKLDCDELESAVVQQYMPAWMSYSKAFQYGQVPAIASEFTRRRLSSMGGYGFLASGILAGNYGSVLVLMGGLSFAALLELSEIELIEFQAKAAQTGNFNPWDDLAKLMKPTVLTDEEKKAVILSKEETG